MASRRTLMQKSRMAKRGKKPRWGKEVVKTRSNGPGYGAIINYARNEVTAGHPFTNDAPFDLYLEAIFPKHIYSDEALQAREAARKGWVKANPSPLAEVKRRLKKEISTPVENRVKILDAPLRKVWMHFNDTKNFVYFCDYNIRRGTFRKSLPYSDIFHAKQMYDQNLVSWQDSILLEFATP